MGQPLQRHSNHVALRAADLERARILYGPRKTGDGFYESVVADPDGNRIELTI